MYGFPLGARVLSKDRWYSSALADGSDWRVWTKPAGCWAIRLTLKPPGGGGGAGFVGSASAAGGGAGGGAGGFGTGLIIGPEYIPDVLYICVARPGAGGQTVGATGGGTLPSRIALAPSTVAMLQLLYCSANAGGGAGGAASGAAAAGAVGTVTVALATILGCGIGQAVTCIAGSAGGTATTGAAGSAVSLSGVPSYGGAGGGAIGTAGNGGAGGAITSPTALLHATIAGGLASSGAGANGNPGYYENSLLLRGFPYSTPGSGGAGGAFNSATNGGNGGPSGEGCGGSGGGACLTGGTPGKGSDGGVGWAEIIAYGG